MKIRHIKPLLFLGSFLLVLQLLIADEKPQNTLTWNKDVFPTLMRHCAGCHSSMWNVYSGTEVLRYDTVKSLIERGTFERVLFTEKTMPPNRPHIAADSLFLDSGLNVIKQWMKEGAPL
jgi:hypothetical protein